MSVSSLWYENICVFWALGNISTTPSINTVPTEGGAGAPWGMLESNPAMLANYLHKISAISRLYSVFVLRGTSWLEKCGVDRRHMSRLLRSLGSDMAQNKLI